MKYFIVYPHVPRSSLNSQELCRSLKIQDDIVDDPKTGFIMFFDLKSRRDLNMEFGTIVRYLNDGRLAVKVAGSGQIVSVRQQNVTNHHTATLTGISTERYNGVRGNIESVEALQKPLGPEVEGETRVFRTELRYKIRLEFTQAVHYVLRENLNVEHKCFRVMHVHTLQALRKEYVSGDGIVFFETDALVHKRHEEERNGVTRSQHSEQLWPGGPLLVLTQVMAHYGKLSSDGPVDPFRVILQDMCY